MPFFKLRTFFNADLDGPLADFVESGVGLGAAVGAVGKDMPQPRMEISDRGED